MASGKHDNSHTSRTIGIAVGLGVGIPILVTVLVLIWVTIRHNRKMREEDEEHKDIDFTGDLSFFSPRQKLSESEASQRGGADDGESTFYSEQEPRSGMNQISSMLYTPEIGFANRSEETFSRTLTTVYGPSPSYPSSERLKGPQVSVNGSASSIRSGNTFGSSYIGGAGPFATPPRRASHPYSQYHEERRPSFSSIPSVPADPSASSTGAAARAQPYAPPMAVTTLDAPPAPLSQLKETPHPYQDLVDNGSHQSIAQSAAELTSESDAFEDTREAPTGDNEHGSRETQHPYHAQAHNRTSTFEFQNN